MIPPVHVTHAFAGEAKTYFEQIVAQFNEREDSRAKGYQVVVSHDSNYTTIVTDTVSCFENGQREKAPHILQVSEYQTGFLAEKGVTLPIGDFVSKERLDDIADLVKGTFSQDGQLNSMPFNPACGVLYCNREVLNKGGYAEKFFPKTFEELKLVCDELVAKGLVDSGWTSAWVAAYLFEVRKAQQGLPIALPDNGMKGKCTTFCINTKEDIAFFRDLKQQYKSRTYTYQGNTADSRTTFVEGKTAFYMQGSGWHTTLQKAASFPVDVAPIPAYGTGTKYAFPLGGASLWVMDNIGDRVEAVKAFLDYLSSPEIQANLHKNTAYVPVSKAAVKLLNDQGFYDNNPVHRCVVEQTLDSPVCEYSYGHRLPNYPKIREEIVAMIAIFLKSDDEDPKPYLDALAEKAQQMTVN